MEFSSHFSLRNLNLPLFFFFPFLSQQFDAGGEGNQIERPVMIHRAILGSVERMIAILCEHTAGKW